MTSFVIVSSCIFILPQALPDPESAIVPSQLPWQQSLVPPTQDPMASLQTIGDLSLGPAQLTAHAHAVGSLLDEIDSPKESLRSLGKLAYSFSLNGPISTVRHCPTVRLIGSTAQR